MKGSKMPSLKKLLVCSLAALAFASSAHAGDNSCLGKIVVNGDQAKIVVVVPDLPAYVCGTFAVNSAVGQRILKICPNGSTCSIDQPLPRGGDVSKKTSLEIKKPMTIERMQP
jgi:hypothetical protein